MYDQHLRMKGVAHDINGLMTRVSLAVEYLRTHSDSGVAKSASRINDAIDEVAAICRVELGANSIAIARQSYGPIGVERVVDRVLDLASVESLFGPRPVHFRKSVASDVALQCDAQSLFRVIFNLTINAVNAIMARGDGTRISIHVTRDDNQIRFEISDNGPGLPQAVLDYLFPRVGSAPVAEGRIGAGLITAVSLAREMEGELRLLSTGQDGTRFCLCLPASAVKTEEKTAHRVRRIAENCKG